MDTLSDDLENTLHCRHSCSCPHFVAAIYFPLGNQDQSCHPVKNLLSVDCFSAIRSSELPGWQSHLPVQWSCSCVLWLKYSHLETKTSNPAEFKFPQMGSGLLGIIVRGDTSVSIPLLLWFFITRISGLWFKAQTVSCKTDAVLSGCWLEIGVVTEPSASYSTLWLVQPFAGDRMCGKNN